ncbi:MAG: PAS domain-containing protein [Cyanobacteria bacterium P01_A01_bin.80]
MKTLEPVLNMYAMLRSLDALYNLESTERPAILIDLASGMQRWCNKSAADLLQLSPQQLLSINSYDTWCDGELDKLWSEVRGGSSQFGLEYRVKHPLSGERA